MAYKVLGQSNPSATTVTSLYAVPASSSTVVSTIVVTNQAASAGTYRIIVQPAADVSGTILAKQYIAYDSAITANNSTMITIGITLAASDVIKVYASSASVSFTAFGSEN
ncbi:hypothetical protein uvFWCGRAMDCOMC403_03 [Freshwater phage uvFW-CGR-AMD-COM-C403]|nr:hypothetical protein uvFWCGRAMDCOMC403_03 [Freshwater phage uvFW-CGR-AMD-COM-C403]